jgi:hypothetical protein
VVKANTVQCHFLIDSAGNTMSLKSSTRSLIKLSALLCANACAEEQHIPQSFKFENGLTFTPYLQTSERYDDNFREVERHAESSWITGLTPSFNLASDHGKRAFKLSYKADSDTFHSSPKDNNTDQYLDGTARFEFNARNRLKLESGYKKVEDTATLDQHIENDKYTYTHAGGMYTYGARTARGQIELSTDYSQMRYQNSDGINNDKERDATANIGTFYFKVAPSTRALIESRWTRFDYVSNTRLDNDTVALLGGLSWDATANTTGTAKLGAERKRYDDKTVGNKGGSLWEVGVDYKPRSYSTFTLKTHHSLDEGTNGASAIDNLTTSLAWEHEWLQRLSTVATVSHTTKEYQEVDREDKINRYGFAVKYQMRRWLGFDLGYRHGKEDSTVADESYERNIYKLSITATL